MKLRVKLTILSISLIVAAVVVCCAIILSFAEQDALKNVKSTGLSDYKVFYYSFNSLAGSNDIPNSQPVRRSFVLNAFRSTAGSGEFTLRQGSDFLSNNAGFDVESVMKDAKAPDAATEDAATEDAATADDSQQYRLISVSGRDYFIVSSEIKIGGEPYNLSFARDISDTTGTIRSLALRCGVASIIVIAVAAVIMWLIIYRSFKPVKRLQTGANLLAQGHYENRIEITGKDELAALASEFNAMADAIAENIDALHETSERRQAFINGLSHELKTPVTAIMLCSETLRKRKLSQADTDRSLERIYNQSKWLEQLSQKLMTLVMLQGDIDIKPESVAKLLEAVKDSVSDILHDNGIKLICECRMDILPMDFDLMRSALVNLVDNARKASHSGQSIKLRAYGNMLEVADHGGGIPPEEIERITEPFYMVDRSRSKRKGGSGLGLALVQQIAEAHGAHMAIDSASDQGTSVRLIFDQPK
jgi:signal transduction histidine kinase